MVFPLTSPFRGVPSCNTRCSQPANIFTVQDVIFRGTDDEEQDDDGPEYNKTQVEDGHFPGVCCVFC